MKLIQSILTKNPCYKAGRKIKVKGLMLHSVGCPQPEASVFINAWDKETYNRACVHAFIDGNDGIIYQTLPWDYRGWHCGGSGNDTYLGVEMCEPDSIRYTTGASFICTNKEEARAVVKRTYESAVELFGYLCDLYGLNPLEEGVILSHKEGNQKGIASNHGDPQHLWEGLEMGYTMDGFRRDVMDAMNEDVDIFEKDTRDYFVRVEIPDLNIRKGPGTNYEKTGKYTGVGTFTIVEEADGTGAAKWGRLKSGAGWIALNYTERV